MLPQEIAGVIIFMIYLPNNLGQQIIGTTKNSPNYIYVNGKHYKNIYFICCWDLN